jgi:hypothetical protein
MWRRPAAISHLQAVLQNRVRCAATERPPICVSAERGGSVAPGWKKIVPAVEFSLAERVRGFVISIEGRGGGIDPVNASGQTWSANPENPSVAGRSIERALWRRARASDGSRFATGEPASRAGAREVFFRFLRPNCASARARIATTPGAVDVARECFVTDLSTSALVQSRASNLEVFAGRAPAARVAFPRGRAHHLRRENGSGIRTRGRNPI